MNFLKWLFHPECSCEALRERVSLAERSEALCREAFRREWSARQAWEMTAVSNGRHAEGLEVEAARLREDFGRRYHNLSVLYGMSTKGWREAAQLCGQWRAKALGAEAALSLALRRIEDLEAQIQAGGPVS